MGTIETRTLVQQSLFVHAKTTDAGLDSEITSLNLSQLLICGFLRAQNDKLLSRTKRLQVSIVLPDLTLSFACMHNGR